MTSKGEISPSQEKKNLKIEAEVPYRPQRSGAESLVQGKENFIQEKSFFEYNNNSKDSCIMGMRK